MQEEHDDQYDDDEAKRRFEAALRAALKTPPTPLKDVPHKGRPSKGKARLAMRETKQS